MNVAVINVDRGIKQMIRKNVRRLSFCYEALSLPLAPNATETAVFRRLFISAGNKIVRTQIQKFDQNKGKFLFDRCFISFS